MITSNEIRMIMYFSNGISQMLDNSTLKILMQARQTRLNIQQMMKEDRCLYPFRLLLFSYQSKLTILCSGCPISRGLANTKGLASSNKGKTAAYKCSNN